MVHSYVPSDSFARVGGKNSVPYASRLRSTAELYVAVNHSHVLLHLEKRVVLLSVRRLSLART